MKRKTAVQDRLLREHLVYLLTGGGAHASFDAGVARFPASLRGARHPGVPYSTWEILEHMRIAQWDILEFSRNPKHVSPAWPAGYWPSASAPSSARAWAQSVRAFQADLRAMVKLVENPRTDLFARIPHGDGQTVLREALLVADHNAYHLGQMVLLRKLLKAWPER
jgi:hypothetical protein